MRRALARSSAKRTAWAQVYKSAEARLAGGAKLIALIGRKLAHKLVEMLAWTRSRNLSAAHERAREEKHVARANAKVGPAKRGGHYLAPERARARAFTRLMRWRAKRGASRSGANSLHRGAELRATSNLSRSSR